MCHNEVLSAYHISIPWELKKRHYFALTGNIYRMLIQRHIGNYQIVYDITSIRSSKASLFVHSVIFPLTANMRSRIVAIYSTFYTPTLRRLR